MGMATSFCRPSSSRTWSIDFSELCSSDWDGSGLIFTVWTGWWCYTARGCVAISSSCDASRRHRLVGCVPWPGFSFIFPHAQPDRLFSKARTLPDFRSSAVFTNRFFIWGLGANLFLNSTTCWSWGCQIAWIFNSSCNLFCHFDRIFTSHRIVLYSLIRSAAGHALGIRWYSTHGSL